MLSSVGFGQVWVEALVEVGFVYYVFVFYHSTYGLKTTVADCP
jgi:hypothetical protein